jgi:hypothetical protein
LQFFVNRLAVRTNELLEGRIAGSDRRELNNVRRSRANWRSGGFSTRDEGDLDAFARDGIGKSQSALHVADAEQVLYVK